MRKLLLTLFFFSLNLAACADEPAPTTVATLSSIDTIATEAARPTDVPVTIPPAEQLIPDLIRHDRPDIRVDAAPFSSLFGCELDERGSLYLGCTALAAEVGCDELLPAPDLWGAVEPAFPIAICRIYPDAIPREAQMAFIAQAEALAVDTDSQALLATLQATLATTGRFDRATAEGLAALIPELDLPALQTQANTRYDRLSAEFSAGQFIYQSGGLLPAFDRYLILDNGAPVILHNPIEVQATFAPISSAAEAFSYALTYTHLTTDFTAELDLDLAYLGAVLENSYVVESNGRFQVLLYEKTIFGCGRKPTSAVLVTVGPEGSVVRTPLPMGYYDPAEDFICVD